MDTLHTTGSPNTLGINWNAQWQKGPYLFLTLKHHSCTVNKSAYLDVGLFFFFYIFTMNVLFVRAVFYDNLHFRALRRFFRTVQMYLDPPPPSCGYTWLIKLLQFTRIVRICTWWINYMAKYIPISSWKWLLALSPADKTFKCLSKSYCELCIPFVHLASAHSISEVSAFNWFRHFDRIIASTIVLSAPVNADGSCFDDTQQRAKLLSTEMANTLGVWKILVGVDGYYKLGSCLHWDIQHKEAAFAVQYCKE